MEQMPPIYHELKDLNATVSAKFAHIEDRLDILIPQIDQLLTNAQPVVEVVEG